MKLYFKQRFISWFDSYDVYNENGEAEFVIKGELGMGHMLRVYDYYDNHVATLKELIFRMFPAYEVYCNDELHATIYREFTFIGKRFSIDNHDWILNGDIFSFDYTIEDGDGMLIARVSKKIFNLTDTYEIDVLNDNDVLDVLMMVLAIDIDECRRK